MFLFYSIKVILLQPRDQYLTKLLKKLQVSEKDATQSVEDAGGGTVESWETLDDDAQEVFLFY